MKETGTITKINQTGQYPTKDRETNKPIIMKIYTDQSEVSIAPALKNNGRSTHQCSVSSLRQFSIDTSEVYNM